jgi:hypothetical protein
MTRGTELRKVSPGVALGVGIAAGFAFLIGLGAGTGVLRGDGVVIAGFVGAIIAAIGVALSADRR